MFELLSYGNRPMSLMNMQLYVDEYFTLASAVKRRYLAVTRPVLIVCVLLTIFPANIPPLTQVVPFILVSICMDVGYPPSVGYLSAVGTA